ncbi:hypothetical protein EDEG_03464 [Edhazardia aedis USNM 41457]|uniref:Glutamate--cysteine ligase n=1 Tax=Edhazardia aedis (strain USNM 41457) TaxID=1003232 RepID=J9D3G1_EDHAE|nr:hypothetical protein EDEG_03464 [Edhazardia aedis USNM 41457]|eukprot:EJW02079.1 hypothetical protein EDEG_03464 [Edhazardia aedis USNM 41457]
MGLLRPTKCLSYEDTMKVTEVLKDEGIKQFIKSFKDEGDFPFKWGDEVEFMICGVVNNQVRLILGAEDIIKLNDVIESKREEIERFVAKSDINVKNNSIHEEISKKFKSNRDSVLDNVVNSENLHSQLKIMNEFYAPFNVEFASYMIEITPLKPKTDEFKVLLQVENCMLQRIKRAKILLNIVFPDSFLLLLPCFPKIGMYDSFYNTKFSKSITDFGCEKIRRNNNYLIKNDSMWDNEKYTNSSNSITNIQANEKNFSIKETDKSFFENRKKNEKELEFVDEKSNWKKFSPIKKKCDVYERSKKRKDDLENMHDKIGILREKMEEKLENLSEQIKNIKKNSFSIHEENGDEDEKIENLHQTDNENIDFSDYAKHGLKLKCKSSSEESDQKELDTFYEESSIFDMKKYTNIAKKVCKRADNLSFDVTNSMIFPDNAITDHNRFRTFVKNIIHRRGRKVEGYIKVMDMKSDLSMQKNIFSSSIECCHKLLNKNFMSNSELESEALSRIAEENIPEKLNENKGVILNIDKYSDFADCENSLKDQFSCSKMILDTLKKYTENTESIENKTQSLVKRSLQKIQRHNK